ncbi:MAG: lysostaphin resistance A-like protein [Vicinamibacterales bacterium]
MDPGRILPIVVLGEGILLALALAWAWFTRAPLPAGDPATGLAWGVLAAATLAAVNLTFLRARGNRWPGDALRHVCRAIVRPLFEHVNAAQIALVSVLAGVAEELLFRGVVQPLVGLPAASLIFGAVHVGGRGFIGYGVWAACIGALFGWLMVETGGLLAPIVAHAVYDAFALAYVRYGRDRVCDQELAATVTRDQS